ncbi:MAG: Flavodoxin/nitric oxide synthase [Promethearchaeota archaeon]|nr:MAG: Flavodoxin/nitric oxide synthase [Candidatus Lokiarchaeota archaeon]
MKICLIYFSPTRNTAKIATIIKRALLKLGESIEIFDITTYVKRNLLTKTIDLQNYTGIIFGFPIYAYRAPKVIREWLREIDGKGQKASIFFTYGGVSVGVAHKDTIRRLRQQNLFVVTTAEFLGEHSFNRAGWDLMENRPNRKDFKIAEKYAKITLERFRENEKKFSIKINSPQLEEEKLEKIEKRPKLVLSPPTFLEDCSLCGICEENCPVNAIDVKNTSISDPKCIRCLRCIQICPEDALKVKNIGKFLTALKKVEKLDKKTLNKKKSKIYL